MNYYIVATVHTDTLPKCMYIYQGKVYAYMLLLNLVPQMKHKAWMNNSYAIKLSAMY